MLIGYMRVSKSDGSQSTDLQKDALLAAGVAEENIYSDMASGKQDDRPGLEHCLRALRQGDTLVIWKLDRLGRSLLHLMETVEGLSDREIGFQVLEGSGAAIDTRGPAGKLIFRIFAALAEFERELIVERTRAGLAAARARGRVGGRRPKMTKLMVRTAQMELQEPDCNASKLCEELGISRQTLYRHVSPEGELREAGRKILGLSDA